MAPEFTGYPRSCVQFLLRSPNSVYLCSRPRFPLSYADILRGLDSGNAAANFSDVSFDSVVLDLRDKRGTLTKDYSRCVFVNLRGRMRLPRVRDRRSQSRSPTHLTFCFLCAQNAREVFAFISVFYRNTTEPFMWYVCFIFRWLCVFSRFVSSIVCRPLLACCVSDLFVIARISAQVSAAGWRSNDSKTTCSAEIAQL